MNWQPTLEGNLLRLRPLREEDFDALFAAASDPLIWALHPEPDRYTRERFTTYFRSGMESGGGLLILNRADGRVIGSSRYNSLGDRADVASVIEVGYTFLMREFWGGEYNRELKILMLRYAFNLVENVDFFVGENNLRSRRAMEKIGGKLVGTLPGKVRYRIRKEEFVG